MDFLKEMINKIKKTVNMSRISVPEGYSNWNAYIEAQADLSPDQSIEARRLIKRDIKLEMIAAVERFANSDETNPSYRLYNFYLSPGTVSPEPGHPWNIELTRTYLLTEDEHYLLTENNENLIIE